MYRDGLRWVAVRRLARFTQRGRDGFGATLTVLPDYAPALVNRGVCRVQLARVLSASCAPILAAPALRAALGDYGAAIGADPKLAVAWYDRALLRKLRARLAQLALDAGEARHELDRARADAREALTLAPADHPWRWRFEALVEELEVP